MTTRLDLNHMQSRLRETLSQMDEPALRKLALDASSTAVLEAGIVDDRITSALAAVRNGQFGDSPTFRALQVLVDELDVAAWHIQDQVDAGAATYNAYEKAFQAARAANAVLCALDPDAKVAAAESLYEASHAVRRPNDDG